MNDNNMFADYVSSGSGGGDGTWTMTKSSAHTHALSVADYTLYWPNTPDPNWTGKSETQKEGIEMFKLYRVVMVYGADRDNPAVEIRENVLAKDIEDAKIKSGLMSKIDPKWDADYLTIVAIELCSVKIKSKPQEVKNV